MSFNGCRCGEMTMRLLLMLQPRTNHVAQSYRSDAPGSLSLAMLKLRCLA
jgi:hypothetical protein